MRNTQWLRFGLSTFILVGAGMTGLLVACSSDDDNPTPAPSTDSGADTGTTDGSTDEDSGSDAGNDSGPTLPNAKLSIVNAATDLGPDAKIDDATNFQAARICFGVTADIVNPAPAIPGTAPSGLTVPGLYIGTGGIVPSFGIPLEGLTIYPYLMNAASIFKRGIPASQSCADLLNKNSNFDGGGALAENTDFWKLPPIQAGTFKNGKSFVLVLSGCAANATADATKCGSGFTAGNGPGLGTLKVDVLEIDRETAVPADAIGTQFIHASYAMANALLGQDGKPLPIIPGFIKNQADQIEGFLPATDVADGGVAPLAAPTALKAVKGVEFTTTDGGPGERFTPNGTIASPQIAQLAIPLSSIEALSGLKAGTYANGKAFTFIMVGDPAEPPTKTVEIGGNSTPIPNFRTFHFLGLENDPVVPSANQ